MYSSALLAVSLATAQSALAAPVAKRFACPSGLDQFPCGVLSSLPFPQATGLSEIPPAINQRDDSEFSALPIGPIISSFPISMHPVPAPTTTATESDASTVSTSDAPFPTFSPLPRPRLPHIPIPPYLVQRDGIVAAPQPTDPISELEGGGPISLLPLHLNGRDVSDSFGPRPIGPEFPPELPVPTATESFQPIGPILPRRSFAPTPLSLLPLSQPTELSGPLPYITQRDDADLSSLPFGGPIGPVIPSFPLSILPVPVPTDTAVVPTETALPSDVPTDTATVSDAPTPTTSDAPFPGLDHGPVVFPSPIEFGRRGAVENADTPFPTGIPHLGPGPVIFPTGNSIEFVRRDTAEGAVDDQFVHRLPARQFEEYVAARSLNELD